MAEESKKRFNFNVLTRLLKYLKPYKLFVGLGALTTILLSILAPLRPFLILEMISRYVMPDEEPKASFIFDFFHKFVPEGTPAESLYYWTILLIIMLVIESALQFAETYIANWLGQSIIRDIRKEIFAHITSFKLKYFDRTPIGSMVTRVISDLEAISEIFSQGLITIIGDILKLIFVIIFMFYVNPEFALWALSPIILLVIATRIFARAIKKAFQQERLQVNRLNTFVQEHITGMYLVQVFNREKPEMEKFKAINKEHRQAHFNAVWAYSIFFPVVELLSSFSIALLILWGVMAVNSDVKNVGVLFGQLFAYILWIHMLYRPIRQLADKFNTLQRGVVRAERVFDILDRKEHIQDTGNVKDVNFRGTIAFKNVWFAYQDEDWVLKNLSFQVNPGETVAFVGATGAGKSSVINLISRFYEFQKGDITIDGKDIRSIELELVRQKTAIVLQDVFLFSDTILNNITLGDPNISKEKVIEASKAVGAHDFIMTLPENYDYHVGERGGVLSVGQRQLLAFIRAYVYDPDILILDEATSSVDSGSEIMIQNATEKLTKGRTSIVIAHRLSTIQQADQINVMEAGEIVESGTHDELLRIEEGYYKNLYDMQFKDK